MKKNSLWLLIVLVSQGYSQCDSNAIFNNTTTNAVCSEVIGVVRHFYSNSLPDHTTGTFPNPGNPNAISAQQLTKSMCAFPTQATTKTYLDEGTTGGCAFWEFGIATNGLIFDPIAAEFFENPNTGQLNTDWNLNALSSNVNLGLDFNDAHVQPNGKYHYHGFPSSLATDFGATVGTHSPLIGYAADGYPIYYKYVYSDPNDTTSAIVEINSQFQLKSGNRPGDGITAPDGTYDGTYTQDYEFVSGTATSLDECNGRFGVTPEYPNGTYYYVLTEDFPVIPRCLSGNPDMIFTIGPPFAGCGTSNSSSICTATSINEHISNNEATEIANSISISPNPSSSVIRFKMNQFVQSRVEEIKIFNILGQEVLSTSLAEVNEIDISRLAVGNYFLKLKLGNISISKKFIKN